MTLFDMWAIFTIVLAGLSLWEADREAARRRRELADLRRRHDGRSAAIARLEQSLLSLDRVLDELEREDGRP
jgi:hypothetical protein